MEKKKKKSLKKTGMALLTSMALIAGSFGSTWAYYYSGSQMLENPLTTSHSGAVIVEIFDSSSSFLPGETVEKRVAFQNTGEMDLYLRVRIPPNEGWYDKKASNTKLSTDRVIKTWTAEWGEEDGSGGWKDGSEWVTIGDYRYYTKILPQGEVTKDILESIRLDPEVSNDRHAANYSDQIYKLTFDAEAVPVYEDSSYGVREEWQMNVEKQADGTLHWFLPGA